MAFEEAFGIDIPDEDAEKITTVKQAIDYIEAKKVNVGAIRSKAGETDGCEGSCHGRRNVVFNRDRDRRMLVGASGRESGNWPHHTIRSLAV